MDKKVVGIDVSKATLDIALLPAGELLQFANDADGIDALRAKLGSADG
jgi:transposase